jgi:FkbM family methyltransferase
MMFYGGWFFPDHEQHLPAWLKVNGVEEDGRLAYQWKKIQAALSLVKAFRTAIDVGGHIGLWSHYLAKRFDTVHAFEPVVEHRACFQMNTLEQNNIILYPCALGCPEDSEAFVTIHTTKGSSGDSWIDPKGGGTLVHLRRLDDFPIENVDFIKLDCEGYELFALQGGQRILTENKPVVIVEQKPGRAQKFGLKETEAVEYLQSLGAKLVKEISGDYILTW